MIRKASWIHLLFVMCFPILVSCNAEIIYSKLPVNLPEDFLPEHLKEAYEDALSLRKYCVKVPNTYDPGGTNDLPLLIALHGTYDRASSPLVQLKAYSDTYGIILAIPDGNLFKTGSDCNGLSGQICWPQEVFGHLLIQPNSAFDLRAESVNFDIPFIRALIDKVKQNYRVDEDRIYLAGFSIGACASYFFAKQFSTEIKAIASSSGAIYLTCPNPWHPDCNILKGFWYSGDPTGPFNFCDAAGCPVPGDGIHATEKFAAFILHGEEDSTFPFTNAELAEEQLLSEGHVVDTLYLDDWGHSDLIPDNFPDVWAFFESLE